ncbi:MAG: BamA/TamA family outer membrane protein, partial [Simkania negevensis]|nr:BamA/TamA family outer membrane protein [Simkania negevensis]
KGEKFHFGKIEISGNTLISTDKIKKHLKIHSGDPYSPEEMQSSIQNIKDLYGKDGYIETKVAPTLHLSEKEPVYDVKIEIEEGKQFRVGLIRVLGNVHTKKNVILRESLLVPGQVFDSRFLKYTQQKLEAIGYFKSVNVYAVKTSEDEQMGENYRDVIIEVDESPTGSAAIFFGLSTMEDVFVGIDLAENNFDHRGLTRFWKDGFSSLRGAGEYAHVKAQVGVKQQIYSMAWINPYFNDSLWRFGSDLSYSKSELQSKDYKVYSLGGSLFGSYPINAYWTFGWKYRLRNAVIDIHGVENEEAQRERKNSGLVSGLGASLSFDSTDNPFKPHQGFRSVIEGELAGVRRHSDTDRMFPFFRIGYLNAYYYPVWRKGTLKTRCDFKFNCPFASGDPSLLPLSERFFLGGETSVRGYKPYILGPKFKKKNGTKDSDDPTGGVSSALLSVEYMQHFHKIFDGFIFFDGGSISPKRFDIPDFRMSAGLGVRFELINRIPLTFGVGFPINPKSKDDVRKFFFSMGGQF